MYRKLEEIAAAFAELETAYNASPIGLAVVDIDLRYRRINPRLAEMNGLPVEAHIGKTIGELVPSLEPLAKSVVEKILRTGEPQLDVEFCGETQQAPGRIRYWREQWAPVKNPGGKVVAIAVAVDEITERKLAQDELAANRLELQRRVQELETLMASVPAAILIAHDCHCTEITGNREAEKLFRVSPGERITAELFEAFESRPFPDHDEPKPIPKGGLPMEIAARTGAPVRDVELILKFKDGESRFIAGSAHPLLNPDGSVRGVIAAFSDITARKRAEQQLADEMRNKDAFLATLSHEVRSPLNALSSGVEVLKRRACNDCVVQDVVAMIARQHKQLTRLVDDLLDISRIGRGEILLHVTNVNVSHCVRDVIEAMRPTLSTKDQSVSFDEVEEQANVSGDAARVMQIITNLITNAHKFSPPGSRIGVSTRREGEKIVLSIHDEGPGIPGDVLPHIFDRFFTTGGSGGQHGLGIGLWLSRELVRLHQGTITAANRKPGPGAVFTVELQAI
ncbi:MAG: PAS domain-containing protein [Rhodospirillaceae bacterium]